MDELYQKLAERIEQTNKQYDMEKVEKAYLLAKRAHEGTLRRSGEPYIVHPVCAAIILVELGMDTDSIVAALLHDVVEDTEVTLEEIRKEFGKDVAFLVDGVTKLGKIPFSSREHQQAENVRKMLLAMAQDVRVIIIKLADRLHNARTFDSLPEEKSRLKALETMEVYAPLAHRLGIRGIKEELEDISLKYLDPIAYNEIESQLNLRKEERQAFVERIIARINQRLEKENIKAQIDGRVKSIYGIYRKVYMQGRNMDEIYDIYAVRVIVDTVRDCYNVFGVIHDMLQPIPNRFKDYICTPKQNMYQSLHTTVIDKEGIPFEVQIRTWDMHYTAEYGVAAHWKYKVGVAGKDSMEERLSWIRQILESQKESDDVEELVKSIKSDIAPEEVFVFTPKGDVITLPVDSTVIDFAYAIHSAVGNKMIGAKVDGRMVSLDFKVKTGMIVEVLTASGRGSGPSRDWLGIVRTSEARNKIRSWFKKEKREENIQEGRSALDKEFRRNLITLSDSDKETFVADIAARQRYNSVEDFYAAIGYGGLSLQKLIPRIREEFQKKYRTPTQNDEILLGRIPPRQRPAKASSGVIVEGLDGCLVKFARCCNPVPGDDIIGFITRGFGVSIHKKDCVNVVNADTTSDRWVHTEWAATVKETFKSTIDILGTDRQGLVADVTVALGNMRIPIHTLMAREAKDNHSIIQVTIGISDLEQLRGIMASLKKISGVISVQRSN
ncbi:MAG: bifunctional (p)ppGpp synthetase/guanosine-3',5'-bis(diphosphate) 3'-pyrophosphohydrolase [Angelakisella sp.]|jgi:GTP pyrophosphokinase|nr:bifunctional (p)ppGpp synthetase/guanosine-3',5'-bis(diphosphate) 3'-pyrophosphohydrolase [Angelakisella sp.]